MQIYLDVGALKPSEKVPGLSGKKMLLGKIFFHVEVCDIPNYTVTADRTTPGPDHSKHSYK